MFRARFDVRDFEPGEISVRLVDNEDDDDCGRRPSCRLVVSARHVDDNEDRKRRRHPDADAPFGAGRRLSGSDAGGAGAAGRGRRRHSREFNRRVDLPSTVDRDRLVSRLAFDGLLTVEAPLLSPEVVAMYASLPPPSPSCSVSDGRAARPRRSSDDVTMLTSSSMSSAGRRNTLPTSSIGGSDGGLGSAANRASIGDTARSYDVIEIGELGTVEI